MTTAPPLAPAVPFSIRSMFVPLMATIAAAFMVILDNTAMNVTIPALVREFNTDISSLQWVITGYMLAQAAVIPLTGWLSDRFGTKTVFIASVGTFAVGSLLCALAPTGPMLVLFRVLQGLGGGCVMPVVMTYVFRLTPPEYRGRVMAATSLPVMLAPLLGPSLAGWIVEYASWRWIFLINVPVGVIAIAVAIKTMPRLAKLGNSKLDLAGAILAPIAFVGLLYGVAEGNAHSGDTLALPILAIGVIALIAFIVLQLRIQNPLLELRVFGSASFTVALVIQCVAMVTLVGGVFIVPIFLQQVRGLGAFETGQILLAQAIPSIIGMQVGGRLYDKLGARPLAVPGAALIAVGTFWLARLTETTNGSDLIMPLILRGLGAGMVMMPLSTYILSVAPPHLVSRVTSLQSAIQLIAQSFGIALITALVANRTAANIALGSPSATASADAFNFVLLLGAGATAVAAVAALTLRRDVQVHKTQHSVPAVMEA